MGAVNFTESLDILTADGTQVSNSTSETIVCPDFSLPAYFWQPGRTIYVSASGVCSNVVTTPGTLTMRVRLGGVAGTLILATAAQGLDTTAHTNAAWWMEAYLTCRSAGSSGTIIGSGIFAAYNLLSSTSANLLPALMGSAGNPGASANAAVTVDTTSSKALSVTAQFSVATNPTNLTCQQRVIQLLN
jgi:hypothetical protein